MMRRLFLIRHGETDYSLKRRYCGITDVDLNDKGVEQAKGLHRRLQNERIDQIYSSDSKRALDFAKIVFRDMSIDEMPKLREMNFGIFEGLTYEEIMKRYPGVYTKWIENPYCVSIPEGEAWTEFKKRVEKTFKKITLFNKGKTVAIVTHAGPIKVILGNPKNAWDIKPDLGSVSIIDTPRRRG